MEVIIDGVKYIPEKDKTIKVNRRSYYGIDHWLYNIRCLMIDEWVKYLKEDKPITENPKALEISEKINRFDEYTKEFLGFEYDKEHNYFVEVKK